MCTTGLKKTERVWISPKTSDEAFEMDELFWYIKHKERTATRENTYVITLISREPRQIVGFSVNKSRTAKVMQKIVNNSPEAKYYFTDGNFTYKDVIFPGEHKQNDENKSDTHNVESINSDLRTHIAGLARRSRCFFRSIETFRAVMSVFVDAYNKFGEAKMNMQKKVVHKSTKKHLHKYRDVPFSVFDFL